MREVHGTVVNSSSTPLANVRIEITLITEVSFILASNESIMPNQILFTDAMGDWSVNLVPNDEITPTGTLYRVKEIYESGAGTKLYLIQLLSSHPAMNDVLDLIVPEMSPIGIVNNFLTKAYADTLYAPIGGGMGGGPVEIMDGVNNAIELTVFDRTNSNPAAVQIVDNNGDPIVSFGGGIQYTEGDTDATITGTAAMWEDGGNTLRPVSAATPLPVNVVAGSGSGTEYVEDAAAASDPQGPMLMARRRDVLTTETSASGDNTALSATGSGQLHVRIADIVGVSDGGATLSIDDGGASLTVDAPVGTPVFVRLSDGSNPITALPITDNGGSVTVDGTVGLAAGTNNIGDVDVLTLPSLPAGTNNIGDVDVLTLPSIPAGNNNIGDVDIASIAAGDNNIGNVDVVTLPSIPAGNNNIGDVDVASLPALPAGNNNIGDVDVASVVPGTGATNLGKAEDAVHGSGDVGVMALGVRDDAGTAFGANGDYVPLSIDAAGALRVTGGGGGTQYTEDAAAAADPVGTAQMLVRSDTPGALVSADGDNVARRGTNFGAAYSQIVTSAGAFVDSFGGGTQYNEDDAAPANPTGPALLLRRDDNGDDSVSTDGDFIVAHSDANGNLRTNVSAALPAGTNNIGDVDVLTLPAISLAASTNNIGDVDVLTLPNVTLAAGTNTNEVVGDVAEDIGLAGNPLRQGVRAHNGVPTAMSANDDVVTPWADRSGAQVVIPHLRVIRLTATPTIATSGYVTNDQVGGLMTFTSAALATDRPFQIIQAMITSRTVNTNRLRLHLFSDSPTIASSDNAAYDLTDANSESGIPIPSIDFLTADYEPSASNTKCAGTLKAGPVTQFSVPVGDGNLYGVLQMLEASPTQYAGTTDIVVAIWVQQY